MTRLEPVESLLYPENGGATTVGYYGRAPNKCCLCIYNNMQSLEKPGLYRGNVVGEKLRTQFIFCEIVSRCSTVQHGGPSSGCTVPTMRTGLKDVQVKLANGHHAHQLDPTPSTPSPRPYYDIVRMCGANSPLFQRSQVYDKPSFSKKKYMTDPVIYHCHMNGPIF